MEPLTVNLPGCETTPLSTTNLTIKSPEVGIASLNGVGATLKIITYNLRALLVICLKCLNAQVGAEKRFKCGSGLRSEFKALKRLFFVDKYQQVFVNVIDEIRTSIFCTPKSPEHYKSQEIFITIVVMLSKRKYESLLKRALFKQNLKCQRARYVKGLRAPSIKHLQCFQNLKKLD
jgi:hypothetical protein